MDFPFNDPFLCVVWANKCTDEFKQMVTSFVATEPYTHITEPYSDGIQQLHIIKLTKGLPVGFRIAIANVINNLRSALDLGWHSLLTLSDTIRPTDEAKFPFADNITKFNGMLTRGFKKFPDEIKVLARSFQPYKGGDDLLWALNRICAGNKHKMLAPVAILPPMGLLNYPGIPCPMRNRSKDEIICFLTDAKFNNDIDITFDIAFDEVDIVKGQPVLTVLNTLSDKTQDILLALEAEAIRLGFIQIKA